MSKILNYSLNTINNNNYVIKKKEIEWDELFVNIGDWHKEISEIMLDSRALYFFSTHNPDSNVFCEQLDDTQKQIIKDILESLIKNPDSYYEQFIQKTFILDELVRISTFEELEEFVSLYGLKFDINYNADINKNKFKLVATLKDDFKFGIFGEILFYMVIEHLFKNRKLLLSKISFITRSGTYAHGSDGIFIDNLNETLFFGESKFSYDLKSGLEQAIKSLTDYRDRINNDQTIIVGHRNDLKNGYSSNPMMIRKDDLKRLKNCILIFITHGKEYTIPDIVSTITPFISKIDNIVENDCSFEIISFPIFDKEMLKESISLELSNYA